MIPAHERVDQRAGARVGDDLRPRRNERVVENGKLLFTELVETAPLLLLQ